MVNRTGTMIESRESNPNEKYVGLVIYFNPRQLRRIQEQKGDEELKILVLGLIDEQFTMTRSRIAASIREYVNVEQTMINETST